MECLDDFPFYGNWSEEFRDGFWFYAHTNTRIHFASKSGRTVFLCGHCYDPYIMEYCEEKILDTICDCSNDETIYNRLSEITGIYLLGIISNNELRFYVDVAGIQSASYCVCNNHLLISSHAQLIGDILGLKMSSFVKELIEYKWYRRVKGPYLPCDLTPFQNVIRVIPNIEYIYSEEIKHKRFWPLTNFSAADDPKEYSRVIDESADILQKNMRLIAEKYKNPWISLTGGIDSNTTFAAANGIYDKFSTFSYLSAPKEAPDVEAAKKIASAFGVEHHLLVVPQDCHEISDYELKVEIQQHNSGYIATRKENESRKRFYLQENCGCDVEVKSWVSETFRAYWYKHFNRKKMPKLSAKMFRNLYKIFLLDRKLAHKIDKITEEYIHKYEYDIIPESYLASDMYYLEIGMGSWGSTNISEMKYCFDITIPYNNRKLLDTLLRVPLSKRISDEHHMDMKRHMNKKLADLNIRVINTEETTFRANALNLIFTLNNLLP